MMHNIKNSKMYKLSNIQGNNLLTLFDIMIVSKALLCELNATFSVVAWSKTNIACKTKQILKESDAVNYKK